MKNIFTLCFFLLFSAQTHGAGKWRERFSRFLPFIAPKAYKLERLEQKEKAKTKQRVASMDDLGLMVLDSELKNNTYNIEILEEMAAFAREEIYRRIDQDEQAKILEFLAPSLKAQFGNILSNPKTAPHFFEVLQDAARGNLPKRYKNVLEEVYFSKKEEIMALNPSPEQLNGLNKVIQSFDAPIKILQEALDRGTSADEFFSLFNSVTIPSPGNNYQNDLDYFFEKNAGEIGKLSLSLEQIEHIGRYIDRIPTLKALLKGGLKRAEGDADKFFAVFKTITWKSSPSTAYKNHLRNFFVENADKIDELPLSPEQVKHIDRYIDRIETKITLLKGGLKRAEGDADKFFAIFKAVATAPKSDFRDYQDALSKFFTDNAGTIGELSLSPEQIEHINRYIAKIPIGIMFLEECLRRAGTDAHKFFATFKAVTWKPSPSEPYRNALNKFFADNAESIEELPFSAEQVEHMGRYIKKAETVITFLEGAFMRAGRNPDEFFAIFNAIATIPPNSKYRDALNKFFADNAENIGELSFSIEQVERIGRYFHTSSPSSPLFGMLENLKKNQKKKRRKKRKVCAVSVAALLSLGHPLENSEHER